MTPTQIHEYKTAKVNYEKAKQMPAGDVPLEGVSHIFNVNLKPGSAMTLINMAYNNITALKFTDINGTSWPISKISVEQHQEASEISPSIDRIDPADTDTDVESHSSLTLDDTNITGLEPLIISRIRMNCSAGETDFVIISEGFSLDGV